MNETPELGPSIIQASIGWLAVDKPPGIVVHDVPGEKHAGQTLVDWLRANVSEIAANFPANNPRPGIVHRLDADTSGVILVAKDPKTLRALQDQFRSRSVEKVYRALVLGDPGPSGTMSGAIGRVGENTRHGIQHLSFSWDKHTPKPAETDFRTIDRFHLGPGGSNLLSRTQLSLVELKPRTGRTHQLRVQLLDLGNPIIGDMMYNTKESREVSTTLSLSRQFLHAITLTFMDPSTGQPVSFASSLPADLQRVLHALAPD